MTDRVASGGEDQFELMLRRLADGRVEIGWLPVDIEHVGTMTPAESTIVGRAVAVRRAEFSTGRTLLRRLIGRDVEILRSPPTNVHHGPRWSRWFRIVWSMEGGSEAQGYYSTVPNHPRW